MVRIGILSDTHLSAATDDFRKITATLFHHVDMLVHAGDMTSVEVHDFLSNWELKAVRGNMDDFGLKALLPEKRIENVGGKAIGIIHGRGNAAGIEDLVFREFEGVDVILFGHSHIPLNTVRNGVHLFNPGSFRGGMGKPGTAGIMEIDGTVRFTLLRVG